MKQMIACCIALGLALPTIGVRAADLGTLGPTCDIAEPHLLNFIEQRLRDKERSGELQRLVQQAQARGVDSVQRPAPVAGLRATRTARIALITSIRCSQNTRRWPATGTLPTITR